MGSHDVPRQDDIAKAAEMLLAGDLVAFPTETVYGLGADAANPAAVAKVFAAKGRPADHPLIVHLADAGQLDAWARDIPHAARLLAARFWPGPLTLILKRQPNVPDAVTGGQDTVGLRVPNHPLALALLAAFAEAGGSGGVAAPSANRFGRISPTSAEHVRAELGGKVALVLDGGPCGVGIESTILDLSGPPEAAPRLLRPGAISPEAIAAVIGLMPLAPGATAAPRVSGTLAAHYAPSTDMKIVARDRLLDFLNAYRHSGRHCGVLAHSQPPHAGMPHAWRLLPADPAGYARELYAALRELDEARVDLIVVEAIPDTPDWAAVADRLSRAVCGAGEQDET
jgi:L-threonylcarbamoyladenylate synthase